MLVKRKTCKCCAGHKKYEKAKPVFKIFKWRIHIGKLMVCEACEGKGYWQKEVSQDRRIRFNKKKEFWVH